MHARVLIPVLLGILLILPIAGTLIAPLQARPTIQSPASGPGISLTPEPRTRGDPGSGWSPDILASWTTPSEVQRNASFGAAINGTLFAVYEEYNPTRHRYEIVVAHSQDGGMWWNSANGFGAPENLSHPSIAVNFSSGEAIIVLEGSWGGLREVFDFPHMGSMTINVTTNPRDHNPSVIISRDDSANAFLTFERDDGAGGVDIMFMAARDRSHWEAWEAPQILVGEYDHSVNRMPRVAWGGPDNVYVVYERQNASGDRDVFMMRSLWGGTPGSWTSDPGTPIAATTGDEFAPDVVAILGSDTVVVPFVRPVGAYKQIDVAYSEHWGNDSTWAVAPVTGDPINHENPRIAAVPAVGAIRIVYWSWWGVFESTAPISALSSWRAPVRVTDGAARLDPEYNVPAIAAYPYESKWYTGVVWTDTRSGLPIHDIYYSTNSPKIFFPSPDLAPLAITILPDPPLANNTVAQVDVTVANQANVSAGGFDLLLFDDEDGDVMPDQGENISTSHSDGIASFSQTGITLAWGATAVGSHSLCAYADPPPGTVVETNEANNVLCVDVVVQPAPILRPDYVPLSPLPPAPVTIGMSLQITLSIQVYNQGNGTATADTLLAFYNESSPPFAAFTVLPITPAANSSRFTATWVSPATPGIYRVIADVDHDDDITEWDETNNLHTWTIEVVAGPITSLVIGNPNYTATVTYIKSSTPLDFSVVDQSVLGIRNTTYRIDGGDRRNYTATGTFFLAGDGQHEIEWYSIDRAGNVEGITATNLTVDDAPPATVILPAEDEVEAGTSFTLTAADTGSGVNVTMYRVDGGDPVMYDGGFRLAQGVHDIYYYSVDHLGNEEAENHILVTVQGPTEVAVNYKPILALVFAIILLVAGVWSSKRRPWKGGKDRMAVAKAFVITSMPFVLAEAGTGIISLLTGQLSIPPLVEAGTVVDLSILIAGICVVFLRTRRPMSPAANRDGDADG